MPATDSFTPSEVEEASEELALTVGSSRTQILNAAHLRAGCHDSELVAMEIGLMANEMLADPAALGLTAPEIETAQIQLSKHRGADRRRLAARGHALPDGSYPIADEQDAQHAATLIRSQHGDWPAASRLLAKRCDEEGWRLPSLGDDDMAARLSSYLEHFPPSVYWDNERQAAANLHPGSLTGLTSEESGLVLALTDTGDAVSVEVARICLTHGGQSYASLPGPHAGTAEEFGLSQAGIMTGGGHGGADDIARRNPRLFGGGTRTSPAGKTDRRRLGRGHISSCPRDCARDHNQPRRAGQMHPEAEAVIARHKGQGAARPDHSGGCPGPDRNCCIRDQHGERSTWRGDLSGHVRVGDLQLRPARRADRNAHHYRLLPEPERCRDPGSR